MLFSGLHTHAVACVPTHLQAHRLYTNKVNAMMSFSQKKRVKHDNRELSPFHLPEARLAKAKWKEQRPRDQENLERKSPKC